MIYGCCAPFTYLNKQRSLINLGKKWERIWCYVVLLVLTGYQCHYSLAEVSVWKMFYARTGEVRVCKPGEGTCYQLSTWNFGARLACLCCLKELTFTILIDFSFVCEYSVLHNENPY